MLVFCQSVIQCKACLHYGLGDFNSLIISSNDHQIKRYLRNRKNIAWLTIIYDSFLMRDVMSMVRVMEREGCTMTLQVDLPLMPHEVSADILAGEG